MAILTVTPPAVEPVSLAAAKARLRVEHADDDAAIAALVAAARERVEQLTGRALITRRVRELRDSWQEGGRLASGGAVFRLGLGPLVTLHHIKTYDADGASATFDAAHYTVDAASFPPRLALKGGGLWPSPGRTAHGVEIEFDAGYGATEAEIPPALREAVLALIADAYAHPAPAERVREAALPAAVHGLIAAFARVRL